MKHKKKSEYELKTKIMSRTHCIAAARSIAYKIDRLAGSFSHGTLRRYHRIHFCTVVAVYLSRSFAIDCHARHSPLFNPSTGPSSRSNSTMRIQSEWLECAGL